jgi:hypothetical protein
MACSPEMVVGNFGAKKDSGALLDFPDAGFRVQRFLAIECAR